MVPMLLEKAGANMREPRAGQEVQATPGVPETTEWLRDIQATLHRVDLEILACWSEFFLRVLSLSKFAFIVQMLPRRSH